MNSDAFKLGITDMTLLDYKELSRTADPGEISYAERAPEADRFNELATGAIILAVTPAALLAFASWALKAPKTQKSEVSY
jgi:hypothetical protein